MDAKLRTPDAPLIPVSYRQYILTLPNIPDIEAAFWGSIVGISFLTSWNAYGSMTQRDAAEYIKQAYRSRMEFNMLGTIQAVTRETLHPSMLLCDGSVYNKDDYPQLWEVLPLAMKDATTLTLPDLRNLFLAGAGLDYSLGDTGGSAEVLLTVDEIPSHSHTNSPHVHGESGAAASVNEISPGVPTPSAVPLPTSTAPASIIIDPTGGDQPHENRPPFYAVVYAMIAKVSP